MDVVADGSEAVSAVQLQSDDAIFMDIQMPGMDGVTATHAIRDLDGPVSQVPIIALTANAMEGDRDGHLAAGMNTYLSKPVTAEGMKMALAEVLGASVPDTVATTPARPSQLPPA